MPSFEDLELAREFFLIPTLTTTTTSITTVVVVPGTYSSRARGSKTYTFGRLNHPRTDVAATTPTTVLLKMNPFGRNCTTLKPMAIPSNGCPFIGIQPKIHGRR